jgi:hypothetical protein
MTTPRYRVVQWATGNTGLRALREVIRHPWMELVGVPLDDLASFVPAYNANGPVNAIPYVCAAPPGILTTEDLPHILPRGPRPAPAQ